MLFHVCLIGILGGGLLALVVEVISGIRFDRRLQARETAWALRNEYPRLDY
jgi:hypothetical protein